MTMQIYSYMIKKYLKQPSTWIILLLSIFLLIFIGGYVPFIVGGKYIDDPSGYSRLAYFLISGIASFLSIFVSVFSSFKAAKMFRDEIEDGSFLIIISKPISRSKILFYKWVSLITIIILYTFIISMTFSIVIIIFDFGSSIKNLDYFYGASPMKDNAWNVGLYIWIIMMSSGLIFSSVALLLSTRLSTGSVIGISTALAILVPITGLVGTFTARHEYYQASNNANDGLIFQFDVAEKVLEKDTTMDPQEKKLLLERINLMKSQISEYDSDADSIYNIVVKSGETNSFGNLWPIDLDYQVRKLSGFATDQIISNNGLNSVLKQTSRSNTAFKYKIDPETWINSKEKLDTLLERSWNIRKYFLFQIYAFADQYLDATVSVNGMKLTLLDYITVTNADEKTNYLTPYIDDYFEGKKTIDAEVRAKMKIDFANLTNEDISNVVDIRKYMKFVYQIYWFVERVTSSIPVASLLNSILFLQSSMIHEWINGDNLNEVTDGIENKNVSSFDNDTNNFALALTIGGKDYNSDLDKRTYDKLLLLSVKGNYLVKATTEEYVNKNDLLYGYFGIGFALVILSWIIVRRKNFQ